MPEEQISHVHIESLNFRVMKISATLGQEKNII